MTAPAVSVIVPNYNHARFLNARIDSILSQTFQDLEIILLDDCSTDDSVTILRSYASHPKVSHLVVNDRNTGSACTQWAKGISLAAGPLIWIAESDDLADPAFLEVLAARLNAEPGTVLAYCRSASVDQQGERIPEPDAEAAETQDDFTAPGTRVLRDELRHYNSIPNASAVVFRKAAVAAADVPVGYRFCGDWLFWARLATRGDIAYSARPLNSWRCHTASTRAASSAAARRQRVTEALRVVHEIHHRLLDDEEPVAMSTAWYCRDWKQQDAHVPWFILAERGLPWRLRWRFFRQVLPWRAWWGLEWFSRGIPCRRSAYRGLRRVTERFRGAVR